MRTWLPLAVLIIIGGAVSYYDIAYLSKGITAPFEAQTPAVDKTKQIDIQQVTNVGYSFYLGQLDVSGATPISDDAKNQITQIIYSDGFPKKLLANTAIVIVNTLAVKFGQYIATPDGNLPADQFSSHPEFISGGGEYATYTSHSTGNTVPFSIIYINKNLFDNGQSNNDVVNTITAATNKARLRDTLSHELGHHLGSTLTPDDWSKFYALRGIASGTPQEVSSWNLSPAEDFAEVYKNYVAGLEVRTFFGFLVPSFGDMDIACQKIHDDLYNSYLPQQTDMNDPSAWIRSITNPVKVDYQAIESKVSASPKLQSCRKDVLSNPSKYPDGWKYGILYKSTVGPATKDFISAVISRQN